MNSCSFFVLFLLALSAKEKHCKAYEIQDLAPLVSVQQGYMMGLIEKSLTGRTFYSYKSIPFAKPPVGKLRFKDPVPVNPWSVVLEATKDPNFCVQKLGYRNITDPLNSRYLYAKEDCLYLNVFTPNLRPTKPLPVIVYIHGGSFLIGGAQKSPPYVLMDKDVILVVIQYRLGIFGFFSTDEPLLPGNMGLKDQHMAIQWVKDNILSFGGDPQSLTLMGQSAGAGSVHLQLLSPYTKGLFKRAIIQSGSALAPYAIGIDHRNAAISIGDHFDCYIDKGTEVFLECMQKVPAHHMLEYNADKIVWDYFESQMLPRVDGDFLPDYPEILMKEGRYNKVDVMSGLTKDEGAFMLQLLYSSPSTLKQLTEEFEMFAPALLFLNSEPNPLELTTKIYQHYLQRESVEIQLGRDDEQIMKLHQDRYLTVPDDVMTKFHIRDEISLYLYRLDYVGKEISSLYPTPEVNSRNWVSHTDDLIYLFSGGPLITTVLEEENDLKLRDIMVSAWVNFAITGNPTPPGSTFIWEKATKDNIRMASLSPNPMMIPYDNSEIIQFWNTLNLRLNRNLLE